MRSGRRPSPGSCNEQGVRKSYVSWARADTIVRHPEVFRLWKEAGLTMIYVGLESMDADNLRDYNKAVTPDVNRQAIAILRGSASTCTPR